MTERRQGHSKLVWDKDAQALKTVDPHPRDQDQIALDAAREIESEVRRFLPGPQRTARIQLIVLAAMKAQFSGGTCSGG
jgi:hypothetical protein